MKVEMRWLERKTGKTLMNDWGYYYDETINVLQYRQEQQLPDPSGTWAGWGWGEWSDVPIVKEENES